MTMPDSPQQDDDGKRRKRRNIGSFPCSKCSKIFTRSDHLARHYLNHQPKEVYVCEHLIKTHNGKTQLCGKTFVRKDLKERHLKRHMMLQDPSKGDDDGKFPTSDTSPGATPEIKSSELPSMHRASIASIPPSSEAEALLNVHIVPPGQVNQVSQTGLAPDPRSLPSNLPEVRLVNPPVQQLQGPSQPPLPQQQVPQPFQPQTMGQRQDFSGSYPPIYAGNTNPMPPRNSYVPDGNVGNVGNAMGQNGPVYPNVGNNISPPGMSPIINQEMSGINVQGPKPPVPQYMGPPPTFKQEYQPPIGQRFPMNTNGNSGFPQSQNDILSWLFMESPGMSRLPTKSNMTSSSSPQSLQSDSRFNQMNQPQLSPSTHQLLNNDRPLYEDDVGLLTPFYHNPPEMNVGLQDLNFFLNNDNPLDEVFFRGETQPDNLLGDKHFPPGISMYPSTVSSSSPSNTNDSLTPRTADHSPTASDFEPIEKRLEAHSRANRPPNKHFFVDSRIMRRMLDALPQVTLDSISNIFRNENESFTLEDRISFYVYGYWEAFHSRFSILHKPSFDTATCEPLLLLSMILIGCMYCSDSIGDSENHKMCPEFKLSLLIAVPLRFTLFQHEDFKSPVKVWILQSLNMLEWCEKNYLLRAMHERAHIHHGTTVQLLRRSPFLGGNPTVANKAVTSASDTGASGGEEEASDGGASDIEETSSRDQVLFRKWVESESMKRVTFMTFYLDVIDYIKFRHNPQIPFFQLQLLNLPCDEDALWNADDMDGSFKKLVKRQKKLQKSNNQGVRKLKEHGKVRPGMNFLSALKKIMKSQRLTSKNNIPLFTQSILFGGLVSIMHQMQQAELQNNFTLLMATEKSEQQKNQVWKKILTRVFDTWESEMHIDHLHLTNDPYFGIRKGQCKFPMYHLAQIIGISDINHYDIAIFGGSPGNMSVDATSKDLGIVLRKLASMWNKNSKMNTVNDLVNYKSVIHCYWLLWSLMLAPLGSDGNPIEGPVTYGWRADHDFYDSMYAISIATLVLWCYTYSSTGLESETYKDLEATMSLDDQRDYERVRQLSREDGYQFLFRIRQEFTQALKNDGLKEDHYLHSVAPRASLTPLHTVISKYCELLPTITDKQNISGLCFLVGTNLLKSQWQVIRENAKLIINCGLRSIGKKNVHCPDLFDNAFSE